MNPETKSNPGVNKIDSFVGTSAPCHPNMAGSAGNSPVQDRKFVISVDLLYR